MKHTTPTFAAAALSGAAALALPLTAAADHHGAAPASTSISRQPFGQTSDGTAVDLYTLTNSKGAVATITTYGAIVVSLIVPDKVGKMGDVVLGFDNLEGYLKGHPYFGAIVGRYGNRIAGGKFTLDDKAYTLATNNGPNHLHGGEKGFDKVVWKARANLTAKGGPTVQLTYVSADGEEGYPGTLTSVVTYTLTEENALRVRYKATTDKPTVLNLTHHSYFNLAGAGEGDILGHRMQLKAERFIPTDDTGIPTGELAPVAGTPFDFTKATPIGKRVGGDHPQLVNGKGYDHTWVVDGEAGKLRLAARVTEPVSGRVMEVRTTEPGVQFYCGNYLDGSNLGKGGKPYPHRSGFCLEAQVFPDAPNQKGFPQAVLRPGETYTKTTVYAFTTTNAKKKGRKQKE